MIDSELMRGDAVSTHSRPKAAGRLNGLAVFIRVVSTHSRPKAAGAQRQLALNQKGGCFNSQPPEGGWNLWDSSAAILCGFNSQPPEGGWRRCCSFPAPNAVSTHSRPKAAGAALWLQCLNAALFQLTAARRRLEN